MQSPGAEASERVNRKDQKPWCETCSKFHWGKCYRAELTNTSPWSDMAEAQTKTEQRRLEESTQQMAQDEFDYEYDCTYASPQQSQPAQRPKKPWCDKCTKYHWGKCWTASTEDWSYPTASTEDRQSQAKPWCETCSKRHYGDCWLLKSTRKGKGTGSTEKGGSAGSTGKGKSSGSTDKGKGTGSTGKVRGAGSTGKGESSGSKDENTGRRNAMTMVYRNLQLSCKHAGGSRELLPRIVGVARDDQQLQHRPLIEVFAATETCIQGHRQGCDLRNTIADWSGRASQAQRDELE